MPGAIRPSFPPPASVPGAGAGLCGGARRRRPPGRGSVLALAACLLSPEGAGASDGGQIRIVYDPPKTAAHREIHDAMRQGRVLERVGAIVGLVRLPTRLTYRLEDCAGEPNAWYAPESRSVTVCYELIASIVRAAPRTQSAAGITREDAIRGPIVQILLHESSHALFDLLDVPILGREEDAADQVASFILLHLAPADARRVLAGSGAFFATLGRHEIIDRSAFADVHGLFWQRFYNLACLAYGSDKRRYRVILAANDLPKERAAGCEEEFSQAAFAFRKLIAPHLRMQPLDGERLRRAFRAAFRS
ncbi:DUF4344 domain-containing metallopeptidase [Methylobacterium isbiliense]|jgi:hypothetical protein|uniref:DUF1570 domain-containing protein n=1 Tax=Methylobacterium isbiliense TaxID=315478 RepID=A0ABQ4SCA8_9HYPH|nr:DUF4344 domain-containing metallopeptidase [Methylobacterium isbiliense]MDN3621547.1 DUF4344 domain-containing metallopeptidase [Methylobacterium isbiliense]GJE00810.1 hypothetical protein GMJLKIPL_2737 [Methylobacterium isbiliense]